MIEIFMPKAGMDMKEGTLVRWLKEVGDPVEFDEPIMEIETDKITMEAESPGTGILLSKIVEEGSVVRVLSVLGYIGEKGEEVPKDDELKVLNFDAAPASDVKADGVRMESSFNVMQTDDYIPATPYAKKVAMEKQINLSEIQKSENGIVHAKDVLASSLAKRIAKKENINLLAVEGSGHNGKIMKEDIEKHMAAEISRENDRNPFRTVVSKRPLKGMRKIVGKRMFESYSQVPTVMQSMKVDMTNLIEFRKKLNENLEEKVSLNDFILKAVAIAVKELPHIRTMLIENELVTFEEANIGFAVAVEDGLYVPVIKNADKLSLGEISRQAKTLAEKARNGTIRPDEYSGGTFSVSNMGMYDVYTFNPIINQPESGILGITGVEDVLKLVDGNVVVRKEAVLCMSYDHRVMDGVGSAKLKQRVKELIENPINILV